MASLSELIKAKGTAMALSTGSEVATASNVMTLDEISGVATYSEEIAPLDGAIADYSGEMPIEDNFVRSDKYLWYEEYYD